MIEKRDLDNRESAPRPEREADPAARSNASYGRLLLLFYAAVAAGVLAVAISATAGDKHPAAKPTSQPIAAKRATHARAQAKAAAQAHRLQHKPKNGQPKNGQGAPALPGAEGPSSTDKSTDKNTGKSAGKHVKKTARHGGQLPHTP